MAIERLEVGIDPGTPNKVVEQAERSSFWWALAIALAPIPTSVLISWALGSPPWGPRGEPTDAGAADHRGPHAGEILKPRAHPGR